MDVDARRVVLAVVVALALAWGGYAAYVFALPSLQPDQRTVVVAPEAATPGATVSAQVSVTERTSSRPIRDANVIVYLVTDAGREAVASGTTGPDGGYAARFEAPAAPGEYDLAVRTRGRTTGTTNASFGVEPAASVVVDTDKPVYRPGGEIHLRGLVRDAGGDPVTGTARAVVTGPRGNRLFSRNVSLDEFGTANATVPIAGEGRTGRYRVALRYGDASSARTVAVRRYTTPQFDVRVRPERSSYRPGETYRATVVAEYFFGEPVTNATVEVTGAGYVGDLESFGTATARTGDDGVAELSLALPGYFVASGRTDDRGYAVVNVSVTDAAGHTETVTRRVPVAEQDLLVEAIPAGGALVPGVENTVYLATRYPDGRPAAATVDVRTANGTETVETNEYGVGVLEFVPNRTDRRLRLRARAGDASAETTAYLESPGRSPIALRLDGAGYRVGGTVAGQVLVGKASGTVYLDAVAGGQTITTRALRIDNGTATFRLDLPPAARGEVRLRAWSLFEDGRVGTTVQPVPVAPARDLNVSLSANRSVYRPGDPAALTVRTARDGEAVPAAVGLDVVDEAVFSVEERRPGLSAANARVEDALLAPSLTVVNGSGGGGNATGAASGDGTGSGTAGSTDAEAAALARRATVARLASADASGAVADSVEQRAASIERRQARTAAWNGRIVAVLLVVLPLSVVGLAGRRYGRSLLRDLGASLLLFGGGVLGAVAAVALSVGAFVGTGRLLRSAGVYGYGYVPGLVGVAIAGASLLAVLAAAVRTDWSVGERLPLGGRGLAAFLAYLALLVLAVVAGDVVSQETIVSAWPIILPAFLLFPLSWLAVGAETFSRRQLVKAAAVGAVLVIVAAPVSSLFVFGLGAQAGGGAMRGAEAGADAGIGTGGADVAASAESEDADGGGSGLDVRDEFPETLASRTVYTGGDGETTVRLSMADSITTWRASAIGSARDGTVGSARGSLRVFQPFFVKPDVPVALTQDDEVTVPVSVFNYGTRTREVTVSLRAAGWYDTVDGAANGTAIPNGSTTGNGSTARKPVAATRTVRVPPSTVRSVSFDLRARDPGEHPLTFVAVGRPPTDTDNRTAAGDGDGRQNGSTDDADPADGEGSPDAVRDAVRRTVTVDPAGRRHVWTASGRVDGSVTETVRVPDEAVANGSTTVLRTYPGVFGQAVGGLSALLEMPTGCFEQTSSSLYPNALVLRYLERTGRASPETRLRAERFVSTGYQRLLTFETSTPGGYSLFGNDPPNLLLTAYGLQELSDVDEVYDVDPQVTREMRSFLSSRQGEDGSWPASGELEYALGVSGTETATTAYVTWSLARADPDAESVADGVGFLREELDVETADTMTLAVALNALVDADRAPELQRAIVDELATRAETSDGRVRWSRGGGEATDDDTDERERREAGYRRNDRQVLVTATATNALAKGGYSPGLVSGSLRWLVEQKAGDGGWGGTQNTIMTLKALTNAPAAGAGDVAGELTVLRNGEPVAIRALGGERADEVGTLALPVERGQNEYEVRAPDAPGLYYELSTTYYTPWNRPGGAGSRSETRSDPARDGSRDGIGLSVSYDRTNLTVDDTVTATATVRSGPGTVGMAMVELGVPPGFAVEEASLTGLVERGAISRYELGGRRLTLYVTDLSGARELPVTLRATQPVEASTGSARAYDYYDPGDEDVAPPEAVTVENGSEAS
jgi:hypothetical protein